MIKTSKIKSINRLDRDSRGAVALISILVIATVIVVIGVSLNLRSLSSLQNAFKLRRSIEAFFVADGCVEEALLRLRRSASYAGGSLSLGDGSCTITVTASGNERTINTTATVDNFTRSLEAIIDIVGTGISLKSWREVP